MKTSPAPLTNRRDFLARAGTGFGILALADLLKGTAFAADAARSVTRPVQARVPYFAPRAKSVIFLFMEGGPSHLDTFDPKPALAGLAGKPIPDSFRRVITAMGEFDSPILPSRRQWRQHGQSGLWVSDWLPEIAPAWTTSPSSARAGPTASTTPPASAR